MSQDGALDKSESHDKLRAAIGKCVSFFPQFNRASARLDRCIVLLIMGKSRLSQHVNNSLNASQSG
jgi:hypothetical protein